VKFSQHHITEECNLY